MGKHLPCKDRVEQGFADLCLHCLVIYKALLSCSKTGQQNIAQKVFLFFWFFFPGAWALSEVRMLAQGSVSQTQGT